MKPKQPSAHSGSIAVAGVREQTTGAGEATVEGAAAGPSVGITAARRHQLNAGRGTPDTSQLHPARQLQFPPSAQDLDADGATLGLG